MHVLTMAEVKFNSCPNLPSYLASCSLQNDMTDRADVENVKIQDFILLKTLSSGGYGKVILAKKKITNDLYAIKILDKALMVQRDVQHLIMNERNILNTMDSDFLVRGMWTF